MYEYIKGLLTFSSPQYAVVDVSGLGYKLFIPLRAYASLPAVGKEALIYISTVIREDSHRLFGFLTIYERDLFEKLIEISGVGPKTGLAILGHMEISDLQMAVSCGNAALLSKVPGIGKKTAERLLIDLRDQFKNIPSPLPANTLGGTAADALNALINLGYHPVRAQKAIQTVVKENGDALDLSKMITSALRLV